MLGGVGVDHLEALVEVVDQHDPGLAAGQRRSGSARCAWWRAPAVELDVDPSASALGVGDQHRGGQRVVLGLADQVGGDVRRVGGLVGEDRDLGRPGLGVDADPALEQPLGGDRPDVARPGDQVDLRARPDAVGEHRDRLGAADGVHLVDAEQRARRQDRRVRQAAVVLLRGRAGQRDRADAGDLGGHDVHQHAGDQRREAAGHVEADPVDRHLAVRHPGAGAELGRRRRCSSSAAHVARSRRIDSSSPARMSGSRLGQRVAAAPRAAPGCRRVTPSNCSDILQDRLEPAGADRLADRMHRRDRRLDVEVGARHHVPVVARDAAPRRSIRRIMRSILRRDSGAGCARDADWTTTPPRATARIPSAISSGASVGMPCPHSQRTSRPWRQVATHASRAAS